MHEFGLILLIAIMLTFTFTGHRIGFSEGKKAGYAQGLIDGRIQVKNEQAKDQAILRVQNDEALVDQEIECKLYKKERA